MATAVQHRRGTSAQNATFVGQEGEFTYNKTTRLIEAHDGTRAGGFPTDYVLNIMRCGAKGTGTDDDTAAFTLAFTALGTRGGSLYCPEGKYLFTSALSVPANVRIFGAGMSQQRLSGGLGTKRPTVLYKSGNFAGITLNEACSLENLSVDGAGGNGGGGVVMTGARTRLRDVGVFEMGAIGIEINGNANSWQIENVTTGWNVSHGLYVHSGTNNSNIGSAINVISWANGGDGFKVNQSYMSQFSNCYAESNVGYGWRVMALAIFQNYIGCGGEANGTAFVFEAGSVNCTFLGASNMYFPTDNGYNSILQAQGGETGRKGWAGYGLMKMGVNPSSNGAFNVINGFGAHGNSDTGKFPGFYMYNGWATADKRCWETYLQDGILFNDWVDDDGSDRKTWLSIQKVGTGAGAVADAVFGSFLRMYLPTLPTYADDAAAAAGLLIANRLYKTAAGALMVKL